MTNASSRVVGIFPVAALSVSALGYAWPDLLAPFGRFIELLLGVVMLGMGLTLTPSDFVRVLTRPGHVLLGVGLQFLLMPLLAWALARAFDLEAALAAGLIVVGCCPGGTASNVIAFLARADVALSITLTAVATLLAVVLTPLLTLVYAGRYAPVPVLAMLTSVLQIVLVPVCAGTLINAFWGRRLERVKAWLPQLSLGAIVLIIGAIVALNRDALGSAAPAVLLPVILHNLGGLLGCYLATRWLALDRAVRHTLIIEVGMQNSGLGVALAKEYFGLLAALPGALFSVWHNLSGALLAASWARRAAKAPPLGPSGAPPAA